MTLLPANVYISHESSSLTALSLAKLEARQQNGNVTAPFSMASLKRRTFNQYLIERNNQHLAKVYSFSS